MASPYLELRCRTEAEALAMTGPGEKFEHGWINDIYAERDRLKAALTEQGKDIARFRTRNAALATALGKAAKAFDIAISLTPTGPARNRLCDMNIETRAVLAQQESTP